jgi:hypothetical protein
MGLALVTFGLVNFDQPATRQCDIFAEHSRYIGFNKWLGRAGEMGIPWRRRNTSSGTIRDRIQKG